MISVDYLRTELSSNQLLDLLDTRDIQDILEDNDHSTTLTDIERDFIIMFGDPSSIDEEPQQSVVDTSTVLTTPSTIDYMPVSFPYRKCEKFPTSPSISTAYFTKGTASISNAWTTSIPTSDQNQAISSPNPEYYAPIPSTPRGNAPSPYFEAPKLSPSQFKVITNSKIGEGSFSQNSFFQQITENNFGCLSKICKVTGCSRQVRSRGLCKSHGGGRRCEVPGCEKGNQGQGRCIAHGGGRRCRVDGCNNSVQTRGLCKSHGGGIRCKHDGCVSFSQGNGFCRKHGGGKKCLIDGCNKGRQRGGYCARHGINRVCLIHGCKKIERGGGYCVLHGGNK